MGLALLEVLGVLSYLALQEVRVLFGLTPMTALGSGSGWSYSETSGLQKVEEERGLR